MKRNILIDVDSNMSSVSLLEDGQLIEFHIEYKGINRLTGNIYKGKVENVLLGLESAFVNIGRGRNGFLNVGETLDDRADLKTVVPTLLDVKKGDYVMVQVTKEETGQKGARLTGNISIPGRYVVFLPNIDFIGISNKITEPDRREKLLRILQKHKPIGGGLIARTASVEAKKNDIVAEIKRMQSLYEKIKSDFEQKDCICLLHSEGDLITRAVRDMLSSDVERIICNDKAVADKLKSRFRDTLGSDFYQKVEFYDSQFDVWDTFNIGNEVDKLLDRKVMLPCGGSLVIDRTEAFTAIDVNSGSSTMGSDHEETVFLTNLQAVPEIARQLRLRNIGGIIVVDFIDMLSEEHKATVVEALRGEVVRDRIKTRVHDMTKLGLVEMTRKKVGKDISAKLLEPCAHCRASGYTPNGEYVARKLKSSLRRLFAENDFSNAVVAMNSNLIDGLIAGRYFELLCSGEWKDKRIYLVPNAIVKPLGFTVSGNNDSSLTLPSNARLLY